MYYNRNKKRELSFAKVWQHSGAAEPQFIPYTVGKGIVCHVFNAVVKCRLTTIGLLGACPSTFLKCLFASVQLSTPEYEWRKAVRLTVSHHRCGVKPTVPAGSGLPSLHCWGFLFLHLKSKAEPGSQQSSTPSLPVFDLSPRSERTNFENTHNAAALLISEPRVLIYACVIFNMSTYRNICRWDEGDNITESITACALSFTADHTRMHILQSTQQWS